MPTCIGRFVLGALWKDEASTAGRQSVSKFLVTGGAGFIGSHLVDALVVRLDGDALDPRRR